MISLSSQHLKPVIQSATWFVFWGLLILLMWDLRSHHWGVWVYLAISILMFWKNACGTWTAYQYGKYQALLKHKQLVPTENHGSAEFATEIQLEQTGHFDGNNGIPLGLINGRILFARPTHALCVAPAGSGKSISIALPAKIHGYRSPLGHGLSEAASTVVTDLKGELAVMTSRHAQEGHGHKVIFLNPDNLYDLSNTKFNPLQLIIDDLAQDSTHKYAMADSLELAMQLIPEPPEGDKNSFFRHGSRGILQTLMLWLAASRPQCCTLPEIFRIVNHPARLKAELMECSESKSLSGVTALLASGLLETTEEHLSDFLTGVQQAVMPFSPCSPLAQSVASSEFMFEMLKQERISIYIISRYDRKDAYSSWMGLVTKCAIKSLIRTEGNVPVHFLLDEATNIPLHSLASDLTALRGYGLRAHIICQSKSELRRVFGKEATETFYSQTDVKQFFGVSSYEEAKEISEMLGKRTVKTESLGADKTSPWSDLKDSVGETGRPLMMPEEILRMPSNEQLILIDGLPPIRCERLPYNHVAAFHRALEPNPLEGRLLPLEPKSSIAYEEQQQ